MPVGEMMGKAALTYVERGWAVIPIHWIDDRGMCSCGNPFCEAAGKHPLTKHGSKDATKDPSVVQDWWRQWPRANIAVVAGEVSNLLVLDLDVNDEGKDGRQEIREFIFRHQLTLPRTLSQETGGGGQHLLFGHEEGIRSVPGWLPGVDIRSTGTYVLVAPSTHVSGGVYRWSTDEPVAKLTDGVIQFLREAKGGHSSKGGGLDHTPPNYNYQRAVQEGPPRGARDHFFNAHAFTLRKHGLSQYETAARLEKIYDMMPDKDDFSWQTVIDKINRIWDDPNIQPDAEMELPNYKPSDPTIVASDDPNFEHPEHTYDDLGNARRLVNAYGDRLLYNPALGWLVWSNTHWKRDSNLRIMRVAQEIVNQIEIQGKKAPDPTVRDSLLKQAAKSRSRNALESMVSISRAQAEVMVPVHQLDNNPLLIATRSGTVDLSNGELRDPNSADWLTHCSPVNYDPDARSDLWDQFIRDVTDGDLELAAYLQRAAGYTLSGDIQEEALFFMIGPPGSGKSTFIDTMLTVLGTMGMSLQGETICGRGDFPPSEAAEMMGKRLVAVSELPEGARMKEAIVKQMSGGDRMVGRHLYRDRFEFDTTHKLWIATNHLPRVFSSALWRRIRAIPFKHKMTTPDYRFKAQAKEPASELAKAAFAWMVEGCKQWQKRGMGTCAAVKGETTEYQEDEDRLGQFVQEECILEPEALTCTADLYDRYVGWCLKVGERPGTKNMFSRQLKERGTFERGRDHRGRHGFQGVKLTPTYVPTQ